MTRPLVSVITPTWERPELLLGAIENVRAQTYRPLEHVVVSDGQDDDVALLAKRETAAYFSEWVGDRNVMPQFVELGRNWTTFLSNSFAAAPLLVGMLLARGEYQTWLADDERMAPDHIVSLVDALEAAGADFAYSKARLHWVGQAPEQGYDIGTDPPQFGQITNVLYRADLLKRGLYPFGEGFTSDWACINRWIEQGATWAFVDRVTFTHRIDH